MKNKMEKIEKIILGILTFILIMYVSISLIFLTIFNISKQFLNKDNVEEFISNIDIISILKDELGNDFNLNVIKDELINIGVTEEGINEFVNSEDVKQFSSDTINNLFNKITGNTNINYEINKEEIYNLFKNNIDKLESKASIKGELILAKIEKRLPNLVNNINDLLDKVFEKLENSEIFKQYQKYLFKSIGILDFVYSGFITSIIVSIIISFIILLIFIRKSLYKSFKWLVISFAIPAFILAIISTIIYNFINVDSLLITNICNIINKEIINYSVVYFIISLIFAIINIVMYMIKKYNDKKVSYE